SESSNARRSSASDRVLAIVSRRASASAYSAAACSGRLVRWRSSPRARQARQWRGLVPSSMAAALARCSVVSASSRQPSAASAALALDAEHFLVQAPGARDIAAGTSSLPSHRRAEGGPLVVAELARNV